MFEIDQRSAAIMGKKTKQQKREEEDAAEEARIQVETCPTPLAVSCVRCV
jgi:hypothetical protein